MTLYQSVDYRGWQAEDETWKCRNISLATRYWIHPIFCRGRRLRNGSSVGGAESSKPSDEVAGFDVAEIPIAHARATYPHLPFSTGFPPIDEFEVKMLIDVVEQRSRLLGVAGAGAQLAGYRLRFAPDAVVYYRYRSGFRQMARQCYAIGVNCERILRDFAFLRDGGSHHGDDARARWPGPA
jgi:hypothetical protein